MVFEQVYQYYIPSNLNSSKIVVKVDYSKQASAGLWSIRSYTTRFGVTLHKVLYIDVVILKLYVETNLEFTLNVFFSFSTRGHETRRWGRFYTGSYECESDRAITLVFSHVAWHLDPNDRSSMCVLKLTLLRRNKWPLFKCHLRVNVQFLYYYYMPWMSGVKINKSIVLA